VQVAPSGSPNHGALGAFAGPVPSLPIEQLADFPMQAGPVPSGESASVSTSKAQPPSLLRMDQMTSASPEHCQTSPDSCDSPPASVRGMSHRANAGKLLLERPLSTPQEPRSLPRVGSSSRTPVPPREGSESHKSPLPASATTELGGCRRGGLQEAYASFDPGEDFGRTSAPHLSFMDVLEDSPLQADRDPRATTLGQYPVGHPHHQLPQSYSRSPRHERFLQLQLNQLNEIIAPPGQLRPNEIAPPGQLRLKPHVDAPPPKEESFVPSGLLGEHEQRHSAKGLEAIARKTGGALVSLDPKKPPPRSGLVSVVASLESLKDRRGGLGESAPVCFFP
jgi:hypothetical protein